MVTREVRKASDVIDGLEHGFDSSMETSMSSPGTSANTYTGIAAAPFPAEAVEVLLAPVSEEDIEVRPDGLIYLPEIKYRRILNRAFGPGAWSLLPMEITVSAQDSMLYYKGALFVLGRFVSEAIGEQGYDPDNERMTYATAAESAKSNCLMRCCKDLGIASELWDPSFVRGWVARNALEVWCVNIGSRDRGRKKKLWRKKGAPAIDAYPWKEESLLGSGPPAISAPVGPAREPATDGRRPAVPGAERPAEPRQPERAATRGGMNGPQVPLAPLISVRQVGRFHAIARSGGWSDVESDALLAKFGFSAAEEVTRDAYDRICSALENQVILTEVRAELDDRVGDRDMD